MHRFTVLALLLAVAAPAAQAKTKDAPEKAVDAADKVICKRFTKTGSLVDSERVCKTKAEWQRDRDELRSINQSRMGGRMPGEQQ